MRRLLVVVLAVFPAAAGLAASCTRSPAGYPLRSNVTATVFWVGEQAGPDNGGIANDASAWDGQWRRHFGGVDDPEKRVRGGQWPAGFTPKENPYYFALPYSEFTDDGAVKPDAAKVPWYDPDTPPRDGVSILKNRWIEVTYGEKRAYAQWQDVGPFETDDWGYVFGDAEPAYPEAGLDLSPATAAALGLDGRGQVSWRFVEAADVPDGPWTEIVTRRGGT
jgi:hypothetical protein